MTDILASVQRADLAWRSVSVFAPRCVWTVQCGRSEHIRLAWYAAGGLLRYRKQAGS